MERGTTGTGDEASNTRHVRIQISCAYGVGSGNYGALPLPALLRICTVALFRPVKPDQRMASKAHEQSPHQRQRRDEHCLSGLHGNRPISAQAALPKSIWTDSAPALASLERRLQAARQILTGWPSRLS